jgi:AcrR family transcriptional regulator
MNREQMLRAAAVVLTRQPDATQTELADALGISRATLHRRFADRSRLIDALSELARSQVSESLREARLEEGTATEAVRRLVASTLPHAELLGYLSAQTRIIYSRDEIEAWAQVHSLIRDVFSRGQKAGEIRTDMTPAWLTEVCTGLIAVAGWSIQDERIARRDAPFLVTQTIIDATTVR